MTKRPPLLTLAYGLLGLLVIAALLITFARKTGNSEPSTGSFGPSGLTLLAGLLREAGYRVDATRDPTPMLDPKTDVPVAMFFVRSDFTFGRSEAQDALKKQLREHASNGGRIVEARMASDFGAVTRATRMVEMRSRYTEGTAKIHYNPGSFETPDWLLMEPDTTEIWADSGKVFASMSGIGKGRGLFFADFGPGTNRFIDHGDNASVIVAAFQAAIPKNSRLIFLESAWGNSSDPGLFESIGDWAVAGWNQMLILGIVVAYTLGRPFGLPDLRRPGQRGQRDLVNAYAVLLHRAEATDIAMQAIAIDADRRVRRALKMDAGLEKEQRDKHLPSELADLLRQAERATEMQAPTDVVTSLANRLDQAVSDFAGDRRTTVRKRKKS